MIVGTAANRDVPEQTADQPRAWYELRGLKVVFTCVALAAMCVAIAGSVDFLADAWSQVIPASVAGAILLWAATHFVSPMFLLAVLGWSPQFGYSRAWAIHALRLPAKYLPGGIWHMVGRVSDLHGMGYSRQSLAEFVLLENLVAAGFALGMGAALLGTFGDTAWQWQLCGLAVLSVPGLALVPWGVRLVTRATNQIDWKRYARVLAVTACFWTVASLAFVVFVRGFQPAVLHTGTLETVGTYLFSWGAGFVAFFAPQGVGVFEFVAATLFAGKLDLKHAVALMASFRLVVLAGDLLAWAIALLVFRRFSVARGPEDKA